MIALQFTSGDLLADRRADYAEMLFAGGDAAAAGDLMRDALVLAPAWAAGWFRLGEMREQACDLAAALEAWREALRLDPADRFGASLKLGLHGAAHAIDAPPSAFVETLFDQYAEDFDSALIERLGYRAPALVAEALSRIGRRSFTHVIDLGCGTGLMGERLRTSVSFIEGFDLSAGMLRKAEAKGVYDRLRRLDLQLWQPEERHADLVVAVDVFNYLGALDRIAVSAAQALIPGGRFVFTVEELKAGHRDFAVLPSRRYAHSASYVQRILAGAGFEHVEFQEAVLRQDRGEPVNGLIVVATQGVGGGAASSQDAPVASNELPAALN